MYRSAFHVYGDRCFVLDPCSKHNIVHGTINISVPRPPPYKRKIWDYKSAYTDIIRADLLKLNWCDLFFNLNVQEKGVVFTDTFMNIVDKQISNKIMTCNDKDAPWITPKLKIAIKRNSRVYRKRVKRGRKTNDLVNVREVHYEMLNLHTILIWVISFLTLNQGKNTFGLFIKELLINSGTQIFHPLLMMIYLFLISKRKPTYLMIILQTNALYMIMVVFYLVLCPKLLHRYLMCLLQKNKLSILSIISVPIKHTATMVYPSLCLNYVQLRLLPLSKLSFRNASILVSFQIVGNN